MPRYHFHLTDGRIAPDVEGIELVDLEAARVEAVLYAARYMAGHPKEIADEHLLLINCTDDLGRKLFVVTVMTTDVLRMDTRHRYKT